MTVRVGRTHTLICNLRSTQQHAMKYGLLKVYISRGRAAMTLQPSRFVRAWRSTEDLLEPKPPCRNETCRCTLRCYRATSTITMLTLVQTRSIKRLRTLVVTTADIS